MVDLSFHRDSHPATFHQLAWRTPNSRLGPEPRLRLPLLLEQPESPVDDLGVVEQVVAHDPFDGDPVRGPSAAAPLPRQRLARRCLTPLRA